MICVVFWRIKMKPLLSVVVFQLFTEDLLNRQHWAKQCGKLMKILQLSCPQVVWNLAGRKQEVAIGESIKDSWDWKRIPRRALLQARCKTKVGWKKLQGEASWRVKHQIVFKRGWITDLVERRKTGTAVYMKSMVEEDISSWSRAMDSWSPWNWGRWNGVGRLYGKVCG